MKLINDKTGEIVVFGEGIIDLQKIGCKNVAEMIEAGWRDYEEPKCYWYITGEGNVVKDYVDGEWAEYRKSIGNYFETKEEAEQGVERLKAWKRLRDKGFTFYDCVWCYTPIQFLKIRAGIAFSDGVEEDLDLLFGSEE